MTWFKKSIVPAAGLLLFWLENFYFLKTFNNSTALNLICFWIKLKHKWNSRLQNMREHKLLVNLCFLLFMWENKYFGPLETFILSAAGCGCHGSTFLSRLSVCSSWDASALQTHTEWKRKKVHEEWEVFTAQVTHQKHGVFVNMSSNLWAAFYDLQELPAITAPCCRRLLASSPRHPCQSYTWQIDQNGGFSVGLSSIATMSGGGGSI